MAKIHEDRDVMIPTIHTGGTPPERLLEALMPAYELCGQLQEAMRAVTPNGRDFYVQSDDATKKARDKHVGYQDMLASLRLDLEAIIIGIQDQVDERDARHRKAGY